MTAPSARTMGERPPAADGRPPRATAVRADIQALRALAVALVVVYHFFPGTVRGGFVGVDVFFVISGFLITSHLLSAPPRTGREVAAFWGRRIRRLLPASFLVLLVTLVATLLVAPQTVWENTSKQIVASALYVENWFLAGESVDYLAADNAASPVQHFWSLSVEEQFYLVWPIVVLIAVAIAAHRGTRSRRRAVGVAVGAIVAASLAASIVLTVTDPPAAYFVSWTRAWELGLGGLAACVFPWVAARLSGSAATRSAVAYAGLAMVVAAAFLFSAATPFPGWAALLPVVGTALVILAAVTPGRLSPLGAMSWRPVQVAGDLSYSIYLWHWPLVILVPYWLQADMEPWQKLVAMAVAVALAWLTKRYVEDRFRGSRPLGLPLRRSFVFAGAGMLVLTLAAGSVVVAMTQQRSEVAASVEAAASAPVSCVGSRALVNADTCDPHGDGLITSPVFAAQDKPDPYQDDCWILGSFADQKTCHYGSDDPGAVKVALVGNSHAGHWLPALQEIAKNENWSITTYLISECYTVDETVQFDTATRTENCDKWNRKTIAGIAKGGYDLVVFSNRTDRVMPGMTLAQTRVEAEKSYGRVLDEWTAAGVPVLVLRDTPYAEELGSVPDCVAAHLDDLSRCDGTRAREQVDPLAQAAAARKGEKDVALLDLTDRICAGDVCYSVVGGVIVYFDRGHLSATFARTLAPDIQAAADRLLETAG